MINYLETEKYEDIKFLYDQYIKYFPIINSVVNKLQSGYILYDNDLYIIIHKFGFSYILSKNSNIQQEEYIRFINSVSLELQNKLTTLRIYDPMAKLQHSFFEKNVSLRVKFTHEKESKDYIEKNFNLISESNIDYTQFKGLDLCNRFWENCSDFEQYSDAVIYLEENSIKGICYSAAVGDNYTEIDIFIEENSRGKNIGTRLANKYVYMLKNKNLIPLWDCYKNNTSSYKLANKIGFKKQIEYNFYNIRISQ